MLSKKVLITGAAGFIGSNTAKYYFDKNVNVVGIDNLSRVGTEKNLKWLKKENNRWKFYRKDIRDRTSVFNIIKNENPDAIIHLAAQVAVTLSVDDPQTDKEINLDGTVNLLEAARKYCPNSPFLYSSTNKVYGCLDGYGERELKSRYVFKNKDLAKNGVGENMQLDFHSPYGCSKGAADQYVHDYFRIYGLPTVVFRQSCIYGQRQFGNEDQGWVIHFARNAVERKVINIYGDGKQVRDILEVSDLVRLYDLAILNYKNIQGNVYNIGGGPKSAISLLELINILEKKLSYKIKLKYGPWRPGDQRVYVSNIKKIKKDLGWYPKMTVDSGLLRLIDWAREISD